LTTREDPIKELSREHQAALAALSRLESVLKEGRESGALSESARSYCGEFVAILENDISRHFAKEEQALFPALEPALGKDSGPLAVMNLEHRELRASFYAFTHLVGTINGGGAVPDGLVGAGVGLISLLREHIDKEDQVLFPTARDILSEGDLDQVAERMAEVAVTGV
jgi:hemerythrin-like domain-containing protein